MANSGKDKFLAQFPIASIDLKEDDLTQRSKFNFSYFVSPPPGQDFSDWSHDDLIKLLGRLKDFSKRPLGYWKKMPAGKSGSVLAIYGDFPKKSGFAFPKHVPHQARWARFRLDWAARLVGFVVPDNYHDSVHECGSRFDCNTFYVVFLDNNHEFWKNELK
jgi:hypothetical protein